MVLGGFAPNEYMVCSVVMLAEMRRRTSLVDMYAKCGEIADSRKVFDGMRKRNIVTWTCIIAGYAWNGLGEEAISTFMVMKRCNIYANDLTM
ncbi:hypothetical protein C3L33_10655, partial [Rhododendron williamsianum]